jgi:tetratricopeptide (TPR) repeat protein
VAPFRTAKSRHGVRHEYLHFMIDPLIDKYTAYLPEAEPFLELVRQRPKVLARYKEDFSLVVTESLIGSIEQRLDTGYDEAKAFWLTTRYDEGLVLAPYFEEALKKFEQGRSSLQELFPGLLHGIRWDIEKHRPELVARLRDELAGRRFQQQAQAQAEGKRGPEVRDLLMNANKSLLSGDFDRARDLLSQVLERDPDDASALYGMAQIAGQTQDLERALELYQRAARNAGEQKWIAAWCLVRRGNIFYFQRDTARARNEWSTVLDMKGDLRGAREEASKALANK